MSATQGLFGGGAAGEEEKKKAEDFINRYQTGKPTEGYTDQEALQQLQQAARVATPEQMQAAFKQSVANLPENERAQFNQMLQDRKAGKGMVDIERSGDRKEVTSRDTSGGGSDSLGSRWTAAQRRKILRAWRQLPSRTTSRSGKGPAGV